MIELTKEAYNQKREALIAKAKALVDEGNIGDDYQAALTAVENLDTAYDAANNARANFEVMYGDRKPRNMHDVFAAASIPNVEGEVIDRIGSPYPANSKGIFLNKTDSFISHVEASESDGTLLAQDGALGEVIRGMVTGKWVNREFKNAVTTSSAGTLIPQILSAQIIDQARALSLFTSAGVRIVPMDTNNMTISRVAKDPAFSFKEEGAAQTEATMELDAVELKSKTIYGYAYVTLEAIHSSQNLDEVIQRTFSQALAQGMDVAMLYGQYNGSGYDTFAPSGIMNDTDINIVPASEGNGYDSIIKAIGAVGAANGQPTVYGINAQTDEMFSLLKDTTGQYLAVPSTVSTLNKIVSNQLSYDETAGSDALVFDPSAMLIGLQKNINVQMFEGDTESIKKGLVAFRIYAMIDCVTLQPKHIAKITGVK